MGRGLPDLQRLLIFFFENDGGAGAPPVVILLETTRRHTVFSIEEIKNNKIKRQKTKKEREEI